MSHQLSAESERIFGYKDLQVRIYCSAAKRITNNNIGYTDKKTPQPYHGIYADDIICVLSEHFKHFLLSVRNKGCTEGILGECYQGCCHLH